MGSGILTRLVGLASRFSDHARHMAPAGSSSGSGTVPGSSPTLAQVRAGGRPRNDQRGGPAVRVKASVSQPAVLAPAR